MWKIEKIILHRCEKFIKNEKMFQKYEIKKWKKYEIKKIKKNEIKKMKKNEIKNIKIYYCDFLDL